MGIGSASRLVEEIQRRIHDGELAAGDRLEPVRVAAERLGLAPNTVASAYRELSDRGLVVGRGRAGTFVEDRFRPQGQLIPDVPPGVVDLASGRPDPDLLPDLSPFLAGLRGSTTTYGDPAVAPELRTAVVPSLESEGVPAGELAVTGGAGDAIERALGAWLHPGDGVAVEDPGWFAIVDLIRAMGLVPVPVRIDDEGFDPVALSEVLDRIQAVVITPRAQNPTGAATSAARAAEVAGILATRPDVLVVEDDHFGPVSGMELEAVGPAGERWVFIRSFSKALGPDLRVAIASGDPATMERVRLRQCVGPGWISHILQRTVAAMLGSGRIQADMEVASEWYRRRREMLLGALTEVGVAGMGVSGVNIWVPVPEEEVVVRSALERGMAVRAGKRFRHSMPPGVRITVSTLDADTAGEVALALVEGPRSGATRVV